MWEFFKTVSAIINTFKAVISCVKWIKENNEELLNKWFPLVLSVFMFLFSILLIGLSPLAFNKGQHLTNAYGNFSLFLILAAISRYFTKIFYKDYLKNKNLHKLLK